MDIKLRQENSDDFKEVYELNSLAFEQENEAKLVDLLRKSDAFVPELSLVATLDNKIVGHILFTKIQIIDNDQNVYNSLALAPLAVKPEFQKKGIGGQLIRTGLEKSRRLNFNSVIVSGHEHYYPKFGFVPTGKWKIKAPFDVSANVFMGIELVVDGLKNVSGTVKYPREFETL
jgi:putative acetyltransferase